MIMLENTFMEIRNVSINVGNGFETHNHGATGEYEFHFLADDGGLFVNGDHTFTGKAGTLFFSRPENNHQATVRNSKNSITIYSASFFPDKTDLELLEMIIERFIVEPTPRIGKGFVLTFEDLRRKLASGIYLQKKSANYRLMSFMYDILAGQTHNHPPRGQMYIDSALNHMRENITGALNLDLLSNHLGIEKTYFIRIFKQIIGIPPLKYYLGLKMEAAGTSLCNTTKTVKQIAEDFGYEDEFYFSRTFKQFRGMAPSEFRQFHDNPLSTLAIL